MDDVLCSSPREQLVSCLANESHLGESFAGYDEVTNEVIIKAVNAGSESYPVSFTFDNISSLASSARTIFRIKQ